MEAGLRSSAAHVTEETAKVQHNIENVAANEANLETKIEKKKVGKRPEKMDELVHRWS